MKKVVYPIVYVLLAMIPRISSGYIYDWLAANTDLLFAEAFVRTNLIVMVLGIAVIFFLFYVFRVFFDRYQWLLYIIVLLFVNSILTGLYLWATLESYQIVLSLTVAILGLGVDVAIVVFWFYLTTNETSPRLRMGFLILTILAGINTVLFNPFVNSFIVNRLLDYEGFQLFSILNVGVSFIGVLAMAFVIYELYLLEETRPMSSLHNNHGDKLVYDLSEDEKDLKY